MTAWKGFSTSKVTYRFCRLYPFHNQKTILFLKFDFLNKLQFGNATKSQDTKDFFIQPYKHTAMQDKY
jgi:hypothetical protein